MYKVHLHQKQQLQVSTYIIPFLITDLLDLVPALRWNITGITVAGRAGAPSNQSNQFNNPWGLALTYENTIYVVDRYNNRVQKYLRGSLNGTIVAGQANATTCPSYQCLSKPSSIALDDDENLFISEEGNHRVVSWKKDAIIGELLAGTGGYGSGNNQFKTPYNIFRESQSGTLYVSDNGNDRVMRYTEGSNTGVRVAGGNGRGSNTNQLNYPMGIYFESSSNSLIIANTLANNIVRWRIGDSNWTLVTGNRNGTRGNSPFSLYSPFALTIDPMGNMYVADSDNNRIQFFPRGQTEGRTIAGITGVLGSNSTLLRTSYSVVFDNQLNLYIADSWSNRVQKFLRY